MDGDSQSQGFLGELGETVGGFITGTAQTVSRGVQHRLSEELGIAGDRASDRAGTIEDRMDAEDRAADEAVRRGVDPEAAGSIFTAQGRDGLASIPPIVWIVAIAGVVTVGIAAARG